MKAVSAEEAIAMIPNGATVMVGGFMGVGTPERLLDEVVRQRMTASHIGLNPKAQQQMMANSIAIDLIPQGTMAERIRAGGCGLGGILTPTGVGTTVSEGKRLIEVDGREFLLETALRAEFALIHAFLADYSGNLAYALTGRNFNPLMAMAADTVIVSADNIVPIGVIAPDHVVTPAPLVDYLIANG
jgi:acetate CoA/acetoacetate CoA-transferase alpha subunit